MNDTNNQYNNQITVFELDKLDIRGRALRVGDLVQDIISAHDYPDYINRCIAELVVLSSLFSSLFKFEGIFSLQIQTDGAVKMLACDVTSMGGVRACASYEGEDTPDTLFGKGYMVFTVDQGADKERYQGIVDLKNDSLIDSVQHYFNQSEQIPTGLKLFIDQNKDKQWQASAMLLQRMPGHGESMQEKNKPRVEKDSETQIADWQHAMVMMSSLTDEEMFDNTLEMNDVLIRLFHDQEGVRVYEPVQLKKHCRCTSDKLLSVLRSLSDDEKDDLIEDGAVEVRCDYCGENYTFTVSDIIKQG